MRKTQSPPAASGLYVFILTASYNSIMQEYHAPVNASGSITSQVIPGSRHLLVSLNSERLILDRLVFAIWQAAASNALEEITHQLSNKQKELERLNATLSCLVAAGLLEREGFKKPHPIHDTVHGELVSIVLVSHNSRKWLETCLQSLANQTYTPVEIIIVDNASQDETIQWIQEKEAADLLIRLETACTLSHAINQGVSKAKGKYLLLLNPDTRLESDAIAQLVNKAKSTVQCAAIAAKLRLLSAPAFLNGIGNYVGPFSWGTDIGLGHLDLGQFDNLDEVPSACFAAALIPAEAWHEIGPLDEGFPLYYEDSEWCYRARLLGYHVYVAPKAIVYHAFGGHQAPGNGVHLPAAKLRLVVLGRLRFAARILGPAYLLRFLAGYLIEDCFRFIIALFSGRWQSLPAYPQAWVSFLRSLAALRLERQQLQSRRKRSDYDLFSLQREFPMPLLRRGLPQLTLDLVTHEYLPLLKKDLMPPVSKFEPDGSVADHPRTNRQPWWQRLISIWRVEGFSIMLHRMSRYLIWRIMHV
ncbi:MAG: glycosyltransferase family 2 protein [Chloroflexota bacterium]